MSFFSFDVAIRYLLEGGKIARDEWGDGSFVTQKNGEVMIYYPTKQEPKTNWEKICQGWCGYVFDTFDVLANDWIFVLEDNDERFMQGMATSS